MNKKRGFTLIELLIVIIIIGILVGFVVPAVIGALQRANVAGCKNNLQQIYQQAVNYRSQFGGVQGNWPPGTLEQFMQNLYAAYSAAGQAQDIAKIWHCPIVQPPPAPPPAQSTYEGPNNPLTIFTPTNVILARDNNENHGPNGGCCVIVGKAVYEYTNDSQWNNIIAAGQVP